MRAGRRRARRCSCRPVGALPELRLDLHDDVVLVQRRVHRRDLPLAEGVVERVVDRLRRDARGARRSRGRSTSDACRPWFCWSLLTSASSRQLAQRREHARRPLEQLRRVVALQRVLVLRGARRGRRCARPAPAAGRASRPGTCASLRRRRAMTWSARRPCAARSGFSDDEHARRCWSLPPPMNPIAVSTAGILLHDVDELRELLLHRLERGVLVGLDRAGQPARVLLREEALRDHRVEEDRRRHRRERDDQRQRLVAQHPARATRS